MLFLHLTLWSKKLHTESVFPLIKLRMREEYRQYLQNERQFKNRSVEDYLQAYDLLSSKLDLISGITYKDVNEVINRVKVAKNWSNSTVYKFSVCVVKLFRWLLREGHISHNPYPFSEWKKPQPKAPKFLTEEQFKALVNDPHLSHQELTLLWMFWCTGARLSEVTALDWVNIDLERGLVNIPYEKSKGNYSFRDIPVEDELISLLKRQKSYVESREHESCVFLSKMGQGRLTKDGISKILDKIGTRSSPIRPQMRLSAHQFRHSFGIRMLKKGVPETIVQKWLGHSTLTQTSQYINLDPDSSLEIFKKYVS